MILGVRAQCKRRLLGLNLLAAILLTLPGTVAGTVELPHGQQQRLLREAEAAYARAEALPHDEAAERKAGFAAAAAKYWLLADSGVHSAALYRNLGHALHRAGELGEAAAGYEAALRLNPSDEQSRAALAQTHKFLGVAVGRDSESALRLWRRQFSASTILVGIAAWSLGWALLAARLFLGSRTYHWSAVASFIVAAMAAGLLLAPWSFAPPLAVIIVPDTPLYAAPHVPAAAAAALPEGLALPIRKQRRGWVEVSTGGGVGWTRETHTALVLPNGRLLMASPVSP